MSLDRAITSIAAAAAIAGAGASLYSRAALASVEGRVAVLESQRVEDKESIKDMKTKIDAIYSLLLADRRNTAR